MMDRNQGIRFVCRFILLLRAARGKGDLRRMMVVGCEAGLQTIREIRRNPALNEKVICMINDNPNKWNCYRSNEK